MTAYQAHLKGYILSLTGNNEDIDNVFILSAKGRHTTSTTKGSGGVWVYKPFIKWKKAISQCLQTHLDTCQAALVSNQTQVHGIVAQQLPKSKDGQRKKKRKAIKRCPHYLTHYHIAYTMNYDDLVSLM